MFLFRVMFGSISFGTFLLGRDPGTLCLTLSMQLPQEAKAASRDIKQKIHRVVYKFETFRLCQSISFGIPLLTSLMQEHVLMHYPYKGAYYFTDMYITSLYLRKCISTGTFSCSHFHVQSYLIIQMACMPYDYISYI